MALKHYEIGIEFSSRLSVEAQKVHKEILEVLGRYPELFPLSKPLPELESFFSGDDEDEIDEDDY